jgi:hypothetical protein
LQVTSCKGAGSGQVDKTIIIFDGDSLPYGLPDEDTQPWDIETESFSATATPAKLPAVSPAATPSPPTRPDVKMVQRGGVDGKALSERLAKLMDECKELNVPAEETHLFQFRLSLMAVVCSACLPVFLCCLVLLHTCMYFVE